MGLIRYKGNGAHDDLARVFDDLFWSWPFGRTNTYSYKGQWVDTDRYDITPKSSYKKELIEQKQERLKDLDSQISKLRVEIEELKKDS